MQSEEGGISGTTNNQMTEGEIESIIQEIKADETRVSPERIFLINQSEELQSFGKVFNEFEKGPRIA